MQLRTYTTSKPCGIVYVQPDHGEAYLPLEKAEVHVDVVDVSAIVTITQHFWQYSPDRLERAKYVFPIPARSAICGFKMTAPDGTIVTAIAKEKEEAKREHETAITQGYMTGLVEHVTDDIFSISLGALPGQQMVQTQITYVLDLTDDDVSDQVRLQIPMYIGARYGDLPQGMKGAHQTPPQRISISVDVRMQDVVRDITSPTHPALILSDGSVYASRNARYTSRDYLTQDFVLSIVADGLDAPRCFAQKAKNGVTAIQLNIVPKFNLPSIPQQEYIFLVDRSGSMQGSRIETAKRTLVMLLRALPSQGTYFNIISFGTLCDNLWHRSVPYDESTLEFATLHIDMMDANYGGTEIENAVSRACTSRRTDIPTACFLLTDGESYNTDRTIEVVGRYVKSAKPNAALRVFTLGIGSTTSTEMCEGIARAGNGVCLMATASESIIGKCSKLVRASRTYILKNVSVDWGVRTDLSKAYREGNTELKGVRQAPAHISAIYPRTRFIVFALIEDETFTPPKEVIIRAQRDGRGEVFQFSVPVQMIEYPPDHPHQQLIPTLAARRAIMDLDDGSQENLPPDTEATIVRLGTQYQLASKFTSFVAVDKRTAAEVRVGTKTEKNAKQGRRHDSFLESYDPTMEDADDDQITEVRSRGFEPRAPPQGLRSAALVGTRPSPPLAARTTKRSSLNLGSSLRSAFSGMSMRKSPASPTAPSPQRRSSGVFSNLLGSSSSPRSAPSPGTGSPSVGRVQAPATLRPSPPVIPPLAMMEAVIPPEVALIAAPAGSLPLVSALLGGPDYSPTPPSPPAPSAPPRAHAQHAHPRARRARRNPTQEEYATIQPPAYEEVSDDEMADLYATSARALPRSAGVAPQSAEDKALALIRLQSFDGSFAPTSQLELIVGKDLLAEAKKLKVDQKVWATMLAVAFLKKYMKGQPELLDGLIEKAMEFVSQTLDVNLQALLARAQSLVP